MSEKDEKKTMEVEYYPTSDHISSDIEKKIDFLQNKIDCVKTMYEADKRQRKINELGKEFLET